MNISEKDKKILIALGILCFLVLAYYTVYSPYKKKITSLNKEVTSLQNNLSTLKIKQKNQDKTEAELKTIRYQMQNYEKLLPSQLAQEQIIKLLTEIESKSGASLSNFTFTPVSAVTSQVASSNGQIKKTVSTSQSTPATANSKNSKTIADGTGIHLEVKSTINGTYQQLKALIEEVINSPQIVRLKDVSFKNTMDGKITGSIGFDFYGLYDSKVKASEWDFQNPSGKDNIFSTFAGYSQGATKQPQSNNNQSNTNQSNVKPVVEKKQYDLMMIVGSEAADLPTIIMGKTSDAQRLTYVYADSNKVEDVELELIENDGKLYCRYKTQMYSYPKNYSDMMEIKPNDGQLNMQIISSARKYNEDNAGVNLKVKNSTQNSFMVNIQNDDKSRPRVKIATVEGKVSVE